MKFKFKTMEYETNNKKLSYYIPKEHPLYEDLLSLIRTEYDGLYEARANTEYVVNDLTGKLIKTGRINLVGYELKHQGDIVELAKILGNKKFETSRILYVKDGVIVGQDAVTIDSPNAAPLHAEEKDVIGIAKIKEKIKRLNADHYYLLHNHPSGNSQPSNADMWCAKIFKQRVDGFLGSIVIGDNNFTIINVDDNLNIDIKTSGEYMNNNPTFRYVEDVIEYAKTIVQGGLGDSSFIIYADSQAKLISVQKISNKEFNDKNIFSYISNEKHINGAVKCFLCTQDEDIYFRAAKYAGDRRLFTDVLRINGNKYISAITEMDNLEVMMVKDRGLRAQKL